MSSAAWSAFQSSLTDPAACACRRESSRYDMKQWGKSKSSSSRSAATIRAADTRRCSITTNDAGAVGRRQEQQENVWLARLPRFEGVPNGVRSGNGDLRGVKEVSHRREVFTHRSDSSRVAANIAEGYRKKQYPKMFVSKMADA